MKKLLVLFFVAVMCIPSYGSILVYKVSSIAQVFDIDVNNTTTKRTETSYLVIDVNLTTQTVASAQELTYWGTTGNRHQQGAAVTVVFHDEVPTYIVADFSNNDTDATLYGKTALTDIGLGVANKKNVVKMPKGSTLVSNAVIGSGSMTATLDTVLTKGANDDANTITQVVQGIINSLTAKGYVLTQDATPPDPCAMTFAVAPHAASDTTIAMTAHTAIDAESPPVEYLFTCNDSNHNSQWQEDETFTSTGLAENTTYTYNVKARDSASPTPNVTAPSADANATTDQTPDTNAPTPNPMTFAVEPNALSDSRITMTATEANDVHGVEYYFTNVTRNDLNDVNHNGDHDAWQDSATFIDTGLTPNTNYKYNVKARDKSSAQNVTVASADANDMTAADTTPPDPCKMTFAILPYASGSTSITMKATTATDASGGVEYQFQRTAPGGSVSVRDWDDDANFTNASLTENTSYSYKVRARDAGLHTGAYSDVNSATTATSIETQINDANAERGSSRYPVTVTIAAGTYNESLDINEPNITLISASGDVNTIIDPCTTFRQAIEISAEGVTIDGFTVKAGTLARSHDNPDKHVIWVRANYSTIQNCTIIGRGLTAGIFIGDRTVGHPIGVGAGVTAIHGYDVATSKGHTIQNNRFRHNGAGTGYGIYAYKLSDNSLISGNTFNGDATDSNAWDTEENEGAPGTCIAIHSADKGSGTYAVTIEDNNALYVKYTWLSFIANYPYATHDCGNKVAGYMLEQPEASEVNGVIVSNNIVHDFGKNFVNHVSGSAVDFVGKSYDNDQITNEGYPANATVDGDLTIGDAGVTITDNTFYNLETGVYIAEPADKLTATDNHGCVKEANSITISPDNSIYSNTEYAVYNGTVDESDHQDVPANVNAQYNWWGDASGPYYDPNNMSGLGNPVSDGVDYTHYRATAP
jgi:hypothetical protein